MTLFLLALLVRLAFLLVYGPTASLVTWGDDPRYDQIAHTLDTQHVYDNTWYPPGYPLFLAFLYLFSDQAWVVVRLIQAALSAGTCVLTYRLGARIFSAREGAIAGFLLAIYPGHIFFVWRLMGETLYLFLLVASLLLALSLAGNARPWRAGALGLLLGYAQLVKSNLILLPPLLLVWFLIAGRAPLRSRLFCCVMFVAGLALMWGVTPLANLLSPAGRAVALPGNTGTTLWQGNNPLADGFYNQISGVPAVDSFVESHGYKERLAQADAFEKDRLYRELSLIWIRENPGRFAVVCLRKLNNAFGPWPRARVFTEDPRTRWVYLFSYGLAAPFVFIGLLAAVRRRRDAALLYLVVLSYIPTVLIFYGTPRYTVLVIPVLFAFAGYGATRLISVASPGDKLP